MLKAIKQMLGLAPLTMSVEVTIPAYDPKYRPAKHIKAGDRVIYRAGVCKTVDHPLEGKTGTVAWVGEPRVKKPEYNDFYYVPVCVDWDVPMAIPSDALGTPLTINSRNLITLTDWLVERELKRAA